MAVPGVVKTLPLITRNAYGAPAMKTFKTRHQFYLPDDLSAKLDELAGRPGNSKTTILTEALRAWFDRKAVNELDERFAPRLDRQQRVLQRVETTLNIAAEALDLFIHHQMTVLAHQPTFDAETAQLGANRYRLFMDQVAKRLASDQGRARLAGIISGADKPL